ncbi:MAG: hypothetical protein GXX96_25440 [Planctomycetaceae bacterium]|nr:hypothetical protein [Planctomycetaceae bacterium]
MMICLGVFGVMCAKDALSGKQDWERDAYVAVLAWVFLGFLATHEFFLSKRPKSTRLVATGCFSAGLGAFMVAGTVLLHLRDFVTPSVFIVAGVFFILRGAWLRGREDEAASSETPVAEDEPEQG